jgi:hypothetical protein
VIAAPKPAPDAAEALKEAAETIRPGLSHQEGRILDQMLAAIERGPSGGLTGIAKALAISKGYASKLRDRVAGKIQRRK